MSGVKSTVQDLDAQDDVIRIKAIGKRNGLTTFLMGVGVCAVAILLLAFLPQSLYLVGVFALSASIVTMLIGWFKVREPDYSIELTKSHMRYCHRFGHWQVEWRNIQRVDVPRVALGMEQQDLGMIGIKLKSYDGLLTSISPRLATNLLLEQRPLLLHADQCKTGACYSAGLIEDDKFKTSEGKLITGIPAMLANRMTKLRANLGYDLFISVTELDRTTDEFVKLLKACQQQVAMSEQ